MRDAEHRHFQQDMYWFQSLLLEWQKVHHQDALLLSRRLRRLLIMASQIQAQLDLLQAKVEANNQVDASAIALLQGLKASLDEILANGQDAPAQVAKLQELSDSLGASTDSLAAAVTANTPAEEPPVP